MDQSATNIVRATFQSGLVALLLTPGVAWSLPATLADCTRIADDSQRLACFDHFAAEHTAKVDAQLSRSRPAGDVPIAAKTAKTDSLSRLAQYWELGPENDHGTFAFRPHKINYALLANYSFAPNETPFSPPGGFTQADGLSHTELNFQISFKLKLLQNISFRHADLWFGYTQNSYWQAYNRRASSPFRETDYQPELMAVMPVDYHFLGMHGRFVNLGLVHQSNGRASTLSRSWNRVYLQTGLEKGGFTLLGRVWKRVNEAATDDDNPDIVGYMGYGDLRAVYRRQGQEFSVLARHNFRTGRGAARLGWAFPLTEGIKGYIQLFSGYGQSLIDYNYSQKSIGVGFLIGG